MNYQERIVSDYKILLGKPTIRGTRVTVELILRKLSEGASALEICNAYKIENEDVLAALEYASARMANDDELVATK